MIILVISFTTLSLDHRLFKYLDCARGELQRDKIGMLYALSHLLTLKQVLYILQRSANVSLDLITLLAVLSLRLIFGESLSQ